MIGAKVEYREAVGWRRRPNDMVILTGTVERETKTQWVVRTEYGDEMRFRKTDLSEVRKYATLRYMAIPSEAGGSP